MSILMLMSRSSLVLLWLVVSHIGLADEPRRAIDPLAVQVFIESQRTEQNGPGKVLARSSGHYDGDSFPDKLVVYTYEHGPNRGDKAFGMFAVAFLTENFDTTDVLFIPEAEMVPDTLREYSSHGNELTVIGKKRLPGDNMCCPSATTSIILTVTDGRVVVLKGEYSRQSDRD